MHRVRSTRMTSRSVLFRLISLVLALLVTGSQFSAAATLAAPPAPNALRRDLTSTQVNPAFFVYLPMVRQSIIVSDDFSNPSSGWLVTDDAVASRQYVNGEYQILVKQKGYLISGGRSLRAGDFQAEVDARAAGPTDGKYAMYFGSGTAGVYMYEVGYGRLILSRYEGATDQWITIIPATANAAIHTGNATNRLKVVRSGSTIQLYANGQQVGQVNDGTLGEGYVGVAAGGGFVANFDARFDNFLLVRTGPVTALQQAAGAEDGRTAADRVYVKAPRFSAN